MGTEQYLMIDVYYKQCRSVMEMAVPVWSAGLTKSESNQLERVQKTDMAIILGVHYKSYKSALKILNMKTLEERRTELCLSFAKKSLKNEKFQSWFCESPDSDVQVKPVKTRTKRYLNSPLPYLTNLLNENFKKPRR
jgi:lipopolysaccharide export LptBFGC system permease protein LptF